MRPSSNVGRPEVTLIDSQLDCFRGANVGDGVNFFATPADDGEAGTEELGEGPEGSETARVTGKDGRRLEDGVSEMGLVDAALDERRSLAACGCASIVIKLPEQ